MYGRWLGWTLCGVAASLGGVACRGHEGSTADAGSREASAAAIATIATPRDASTSFYADRFSRRPRVDAMTDLGRKVFFDPSLSVSGTMSCATCHDPRFAYGPPNGRATQLGGPDMKQAGMRAVPSLRYLQKLPPFDEHHFEEEGDESVDQGPTGGFAWDGRAATTHDQARLPLTSPFEMANPSMAAVTEKVAAGPLAPTFRATFGDDVFADAERGAAAILMVLEVFQQSPKDFYPYTSRYDAWLRRQGELSPREERGMALFADAKKGNCASCHPNGMRNGSFPQFTDYGFGAIGAPRNRDVPANADPAFHDLGLCGPLRTDLSAHKEYCGQFRVPTLRNVAVRQAFFHNGVFHRLEDVLVFYAQRDSRPGKFYPAVSGHTEPFDDLPAEYRRNVNREPPFGRPAGAAPALSAAEIGDLVAFLETLNDADVQPVPTK
jgi:cytochrome c peroxidase